MADFDFKEEFNTEAEVPEMDTNAPEEAAASEKQVYTLNDGSEGSRAAFIREKFLEDNMSRKEISETFGFAYRIVYSATVNMTNDAEATTRGRAAVNAVINVTENNELVTEDADGNVFVNGEAVDVKPETVEKSRNEWVKESVEAGVSRGDIAKWLDISYGVIYNLTKEQDGVRVKHDITLEDGTVISRSEYIRRQFAAGISRGDIAKELEVPYSVVWQATKTEKTDADKFAEAVATIETFADKVEDVDMFNNIIVSLKNVAIKAEAEATAEDTIAE